MQDTPKYIFHDTTSDAWNAMLRACGEAKSCIKLEEFIFVDDKIGKSFLELFLKKANCGIKISLLFDWYGCRALKKSNYYKKLLNAGVEIRFFNPPSLKWINPFNFFPRDHRKILIVDEYKSFVGGVCIFDEITNWRDTMVELDGDITKQLEYIFDSTWKKVIGNERIIKAHPNFETNKNFSIYANAPDSNENLFSKELFKKINNAKNSIKLATPYFTPSEDLQIALVDAASRGVEVEIILSKNLDKYTPFVVAQKIARELITKGVKFYNYQPCILHLKSMIIDEKWCAIGSCNLDGLSIYHNQESMLVADEQKFLEKINYNFEKDKSNSKKLDLNHFEKIKFKNKIAGILLSPFKHYI